MKKFCAKRCVAAVFACAAISVFSVLSVGCSKTEDPTTQTVVSYVSTDSRVQSSTADVVADVADTVVEISTETVKTQWGAQYIVSGAGSGVIIGKSGSLYYIVTNNHVIAGANDINVFTRGGVEYSASLVATDDSADIAVITVSTSDTLKIATWGNSDSLSIGEDLIAIGNPLGSLGGTVTKGILSATGRTITVGDFAMTLLQTDTAINPGNSGGGLFNMRGELIGVVNAKTSDEEIEGICFAIPSNTAKDVCDDLMRLGYLEGRATLPITVVEGALSSGMNTQAQTIVYVTDATGAASNTFKQYDRIYKINGEQISSIVEYNAALAKLSPGESVAVQVFRGSKSQSMWGNNITFASDVTEFTVTALQYGA
ncbi:MAG: trypsin-like peptidase domain-containing protein [Roseburia sp.]|nr:trypsin-like peptidase domain-containing protein [Roseburia sp.]